VTAYEVIPRNPDMTRGPDPVSGITQLTHTENDLQPDTWVVEGDPDGMAAILQAGVGSVLTDDGEQVGSGVVAGITRSQISDDNNVTRQYAAVTFVSDYIAATDRLALPLSTRPIGPLAATTYGADTDTRTDSCESLILGYVSSALGPAAVAERRLTGLVMPTSAHRGPQRTVSARNDPLWQLVQPLAEAGNLALDIVHVEDGLSAPHRLFVVADAPDVSNLVRFGDVDSPAMGRLVTWSYVIAPGSSNTEYVAGGGEADARTVLLVQDTDSVSLWGRRIEALVDQRQVDPAAVDLQLQLFAAGEDALAQANPVATVTANVEDTPDVVINGVTVPGLAYRRDYRVGWTVGIDLPGLSMTARVRKVVTTWPGDGGAATRVITVGAFDAGLTVPQRQLAAAIRAISKERNSR
jgi:hypothetical protein